LLFVIGLGRDEGFDYIKKITSYSFRIIKKVTADSDLRHLRKEPYTCCIPISC